MEKLNATWFTLQKRDRAVLAPASVVIVLIFAAIVGPIIALNWRGFGAIATFVQLAPRAAEIDQQTAMNFLSAMFGLVGGIVLAMIPLSIAWAAYEAACLRWMIRSEAPGLFGLTLNNDTWRVYGIYWCWVALNMAVGMALSIVTMPLLFMAMPDLMAAKTQEEMFLVQMRVQAPAMLLQYAALAFFGTRFAPASAIAVARKQFAFITAWNVTAGRFWQLFGSFALIWLIAGAAGLVVAAILVGPTLLEVAPLLSQMVAKPIGPETTEVLQRLMRIYFSPNGFIVIGLNYLAFGLVTLFRFLMQFGINARVALAALEEGKITPVEASS